jgi:hypothetical protein
MRLFPRWNETRCSLISNGMSVFATQKKTSHARTVAILIAVCAVVAGSVLVGRMIEVPLTAALRDAAGFSPVIPAETPSETVFPKPRVIDWEGTVFGILAGGNGLAIKRPDGGMFQAYMAEGRTSSVSQGPVHIKGRWTGTSCAYQNTVFSGQCTPTVEIDALEILPISLE